MAAREQHCRGLSLEFHASSTPGYGLIFSYRSYLYESKIIPDVLDGVAEVGRRVQMQLKFSQTPIRSGDLIPPEQVTITAVLYIRAHKLEAIQDAEGHAIELVHGFSVLWACPCICAYVHPDF